nr:DUF6273 domain-containing protein [Eubacterium sp.]
MKCLLNKGIKKGMRRGLALMLAAFISVSTFEIGNIQTKAEQAAKSATNSYGLQNPRVAFNYRDTVIFGHYWQEDTNKDGVIDSKDEKQPIVWQILEKYDDGTALVLSDKILDLKPYNDKKNSGTYACTWETSSIRSWLNSDFYNAAFTSSEHSSIIKSTVKNSKHPVLGTSGGNNTNDYLFLLSIDEATNTKYGFNSSMDYRDENRVSKAVPGISRNFEGLTSWLLRAPVGDTESTCLTPYIENGKIETKILKPSVAGGIKPAMRINLLSSYVTKGDKIKISVKGTEWDTVKFGKYNDQEITWRVLNVSGNDAFLLSDKILTTRACNEIGTNLSSSFGWSDCDLRQWLNS